MKQIKISKKAMAVIASLTLLVNMPSHASGVPVVDFGNIAQAVVQVQNQVQQIEQMHRQIKAITDNGNYAGIIDDPKVRSALNKYLPKGYTDIFDAARRGDIRALEQVVKLAEQEERRNRNAQTGKARVQAAVLKSKAQLKVAMDNMNSDVAKIRGLMNQINRTQNPAQKTDLTNTLMAQSAMMQANAATMQIMMQQAQQEEKLAKQQLQQENYMKYKQLKQENLSKKYPNATKK